ncbi:MAG TPA: molybdate ABC transporter substrate-binding protein, partial [Acidimicrobiales bacterium]
MHSGSRKVIALAALALVAACGGGAGSTADSTAASSTSVPGSGSSVPGSTVGPQNVLGTITVFAASSLTGAFTELGDVFERANPEASVRFSFASSSEVVRQVTQGAPADVVATADTSTMRTLTDGGGNAGEPEIFATSALEIMVAAGNPKGIKGLADLARPGVIVVLCATEVPAGRYAHQALEKAGVFLKPRSLEQNVKAAASKVILGEADAAIVYTTDVLAAEDKAAGVVIPPEH